MDIEALSDHVFVIPDEEDNVSDGGIALLHTPVGKPQRGTVHSAGPGRVAVDGILIPMKLREGDRVLFVTVGRHVIADGTEYVVMYEHEVLALCHNEGGVSPETEDDAH